MAVIACKKARLARIYPGVKANRGKLRRIVKLIDGGNAKKLPLMELYCGHQMRTAGRFSACCKECSGKGK